MLPAQAVGAGDDEVVARAAEAAAGNTAALDMARHEAAEDAGEAKVMVVEEEEEEEPGVPKAGPGGHERLFEAQAGAERPETVPRAQTGSGSPTSMSIVS